MHIKSILLLSKLIILILHIQVLHSLCVNHSLLLHPIPLSQQLLIINLSRRLPEHRNRHDLLLPRILPLELLQILQLLWIGLLSHYLRVVCREELRPVIHHRSLAVLLRGHVQRHLGLHRHPRSHIQGGHLGVLHRSCLSKELRGLLTSSLWSFLLLLNYFVQTGHLGQFGQLFFFLDWLLMINLVLSLMADRFGGVDGGLGDMGRLRAPLGDFESGLIFDFYFLMLP